MNITNNYTTVYRSTVYGCARLGKEIFRKHQMDFIIDIYNIYRTTYTQYDKTAQTPYGRIYGRNAALKSIRHSRKV
jgi:hypothetical protein